MNYGGKKDIIQRHILQVSAITAAPIAESSRPTRELFQDT
jgi:hypothetical protein